METLVIAHHRDGHQHYGRSRRYWRSRDDCFSSPPANFRNVNCRSYESGNGLLPVPFNVVLNSTPVNGKQFRIPRTVSPRLTENRKSSTRFLKGQSVPVPIKIKFDKLHEDMPFSKRWAGPAYSNSPPPSSLPIPRFSFQPKRTTSLELPPLVCKTELEPLAKSAPASPLRSASPCDAFDFSESATKSLRRILNLDIADQ